MSNEDKNHEDLCKVALSICVDKIKDKYPTFQLADGDKLVIVRFMVANNLCSLSVDPSIPVINDKVEVSLITEDGLAKAVVELSLAGARTLIVVGPDIDDQDAKEINADSKLIADAISEATKVSPNFNCSIDATKMMAQLMFMYCIDSINVEATKGSDLSNFTMTLISGGEDMIMVGFFDNGEISGTLELFHSSPEVKGVDESTSSDFDDAEKPVSEILEEESRQAKANSEVKTQTPSAVNITLGVGLAALGAYALWKLYKCLASETETL